MIGRYFDYNATTPLHPLVSEVMTQALDTYGNPSSVHNVGMSAKDAVVSARQQIAAFLQCEPDELYFTSGGSESNNWVIKGYLNRWSGSPFHAVSSVIEHPSVRDTLRYWCQSAGGEVTFVPVDEIGCISAQKVIDAIRPDTKLITIMLANNETGVIQPIQEIAAAAKSRGIFFHTDAVQAVGKMPIRLQELGVDALSFSIHKLCGPKGVGGLYVNKAYALEPLIHGGGQEMGLRSGTENVVSLIGAAEACRVAQMDMAFVQAKLFAYKHRIIDQLRLLVPNLKVNGPMGSGCTLANTINIGIPGIRGEALAAYLDQRFGIAVSVGSACSSNQEKKLSYVLQEMGLDEDEIRSSVRISMGAFTNESDVGYFLQCMEHSLVHFYHCMPS
ncbi:cysteine desulfurase family protein [Paenibacillus planticolens]|uniref:Aminotransferase class V-fold PLP-dependent enzyme n=1 Tax=Paenibacillus planticolens TaxID=2654976 RepID=A0ABX1ZL77_9BACL|nr:cysteine desulfurase family protein [Paenibacillus planticolens]NOV00850.1 aminotransferase class V-fold PLP-dependent enzyme [Paenibacillus planticolens]